MRKFIRDPRLLLALTLAGATIALGLVATSARRTYRTLEAASVRRQSAYEFLMALRQTRQHVGEARVGLTGYVLTRDSAYRATYLSGIAGFASDTIALRALGGDQATLVATLERLGPALVAYEAALARMARVAEHSPSALERDLRASRDFVLLDEIRKAVFAIEEEQKRLLAVGARDVSAAVRRSHLIITIATILGAVVLLGAGAALAAQLAARERTEAALHESEQRFLQAQKMEAVGRLAGGVAHDFNNLLTVIFAQTDLTLSELGPQHPSVASALREIRETAERATALTQQLLAFSRQQLVEPVVFSVNQAVADLKKIVGHLLGEDVEVVTRLEPDAGSVKADRGQFEQVLLNLVVNARDAMPNGGSLTLHTANVTLDDGYARSRPEVQAGDYVMLAVSDTGTGMTEEVKARIFEPFFTTKERGRGTGLGLATCFGIVKQAGGHLAVYSEVGVGTTFRVYLPRVAMPAEPTEAPDAMEAVALPRGDETILLVEDDQAVRKAAGRLLRMQGYRVLEAGDGEEAKRTLDSHYGPVHLLLTDVVLPRMGGRELAEQVQVKRPGIAVLFASGYTDDVVFHHRLLDHEVALLQKPFTQESMARKVREVLDQRA